MISSVKIRDYLKSDKRDFKMFKIKLSDKEQQNINNLDIADSKGFNYCGDINSLDFDNFLILFEADARICHNKPMANIDLKNFMKSQQKVLDDFHEVF